jgi:putative NADPH-quinone reductase
MLRGMDARRILLIQGHPDPAGGHLCHELAAAYVRGVHEGGHELRTADVSGLDFPLLRSSHEWESSPVPPDIAKVQQDILWAQHVVMFFPLWISDIPALLKGFLEQVARPGFAFRRKDDQPFGHKALEGRSARIVVTMGMPSMIYRLVYREHALRALERDVLAFVGFDPVHETLVGLAEALGAEGIAKWRDELHRLGRAGE